MMISGNARFAIVALSLAAAALFLDTRAQRDVLPPGLPLASAPLQLGEWSGRDIPFAPATLVMLGQGEFVQRTYLEPRTDAASIDLFLAHRPRARREALDSHLPADCLIGSGWTLVESNTVSLPLAGYPEATANRYVIVKGGDRQLVLFWFFVHGRSLASENWADFYLTVDYLRRNRNDCVLVRINTPLRSGENADEAQRRLLSFAAQFVPLLEHISS